MKSIIDYKEDIYKCSKCGLCQAVCPIYKITKNECILSRGKFTILNGIIDNKFTLNKKNLQNFELCLNCNACKNYCPSDIDARTIFSTVKNDYHSKNKSLKDILYKNWFFYLKMNVIGFLAKIYRLFLIDKIIDKITPIFMKSGKIGKFIIFANSALKINVKRKRKISNKTSKGKVVFFEGCFNKYINPSSKNATLNLIEELGYGIVKIDLKCCGVSNFNAGYFDEFEKQAKEIIQNIPKDIDAIVCDCATCISVLKSYKDFFEEAAFIYDKTIGLTEFLEKNNYKKTFAKKHKITYHKPCHEHYNNENLLKNLENIQFIPLDDNEACCGFAGEFAIKHSKISKEISKQKANSIINKSPDIIVTSCPSCLMGLNQGLIQVDENKTTLNISEFLNLD